MTPADYCREKGWQVGDVLEGDEGYGNGPERIVITAICRYYITAVMEKSEHQSECLWMLDRRDWRKIGHMDPFADPLVWPE